MIDSVLLARKLALFHPTSFSVDDLKSLVSRPHLPAMRKGRTSNEKVEFIPPIPTVSVIKEAPIQSTSEKKPVSNRFANLFANTKPTMQTIQNVRMQYDLPNLTRIQTPTKAVRPIMIVNLSNHSPFNVNTKNTSQTIPGSMQIHSSTSSSDSEDAYK